MQNNNVELWFTMGPNSREPDAVRELLSAGATGARLTLSYSTPEWHIEKAKLLKSTAQSLGKNCMAIADLEGEKFRIGNFIEPQHVKVENGNKVTFTYSSETWEKVKDCIPLKSKEFIKYVNKGDMLVIGDASAVFLVDSVDEDVIYTSAIGDGTINPNRGVLVQNAIFQPSSFTTKDQLDLTELLKESQLFDAVALSFVSSANDIKEARNLLKQHGVSMPIIAKIETQAGIDNIMEIAKEADYLMAARGDLALFTPWVDLYGQVQKISIAAKQYGKKWILATQIAEGMERFAFPTRAEICDLSHWLSDGVDGVMVSYETAFGPKPKQVIECISKLINHIVPK